MALLAGHGPRRPRMTVGNILVTAWKSCFRQALIACLANPLPVDA